MNHPSTRQSGCTTLNHPSTRLSGCTTWNHPPTRLLGCTAMNHPTTRQSGCTTLNHPSTRLSGCTTWNHPPTRLLGCTTMNHPSTRLSGCTTWNHPSTRQTGCTTTNHPSTSTAYNRHTSERWHKQHVPQASPSRPTSTIQPCCTQHQRCGTFPSIRLSPPSLLLSIRLSPPSLLPLPSILGLIHLRPAGRGSTPLTESIEFLSSELLRRAHQLAEDRLH